MKSEVVLRFFLMCGLGIRSVNCVSWMVSNVLLASSTMQLNQADLALTMSVSAGAFTAIAECRHQFRYETWSCPEQAFYLNEAANNAKRIPGRESIRQKYLTPEDNKPKSNKRPVKASRSLKFKNGNRMVTNEDEDDKEEEETNNHNNYHNNKVMRRKARKRMPKVVANNEISEDNLQKLPDWKGLRRATTRETAFVHAITAAGITHTLTKNCSSGDFPDCVCDNRLTRRQLGWEWGGCSDNFGFGSQVAKQFLDTVESGADSRSLANLHNNEAGRTAVRKTMRRLCKCHGVSGSCATKTCWRQISEFREVGNYLKNMYHQAMKVDFENGFLDHTDNTLSNRIGRTTRGGNTPIDRFRRRSNKLKKRKLVFIEDSPDYCRKNATAGFPGVIGRTCSTEPGNPKSKVSVETCKNLCERCGLKVRRRVIEVPTSCNCTFTWCCHVSCKTCITKRIEITCVP